MKKKLTRLKDILCSMHGVLVAYSGGVDSTFLLKIASDVLDGNVLAVTAHSPTFPRTEEECAIRMAKRLHVKHIIIKTKELKEPRFVRNDRHRCYWCKTELFTKLLSMAEQAGLKYVVDGSNYDDIKDYRPGLKAIHELGIQSPLIEAKLTKKEIRKVSQSLHLTTFNKPSFACLASRFPYGTKITSPLLKRIARAENVLREEGFMHVRVRHHGNIARIEIAPEEIPKLLKGTVRQRVYDQLRKLQYTYITLDLEGYRTGSMNEAIGKIK